MLLLSALDGLVVMRMTRHVFVLTPGMLQITGNTVNALVERESDNSCELHTPMAFAEICRHIANVGEIACAAVNPIKRRHFYLAITGSFKLAMAPGVAAKQLLLADLMSCCHTLSCP